MDSKVQLLRLYAEQCRRCAEVARNPGAASLFRALAVDLMIEADQVAREERRQERRERTARLLNQAKLGRI